MGEHKAKEKPDWVPIPEDRLASDIWLWFYEGNQRVRMDYVGVGVCAVLADFLRLKGHIKEGR